VSAAPPSAPRSRSTRRVGHEIVPDDDSWIIRDGRPCFVVGYTPGGAPYGIITDEIPSDEDWV